MAEQKGIDGPTHPVAEMIAQGMTVMRVENESQQSMATMKPRSEDAVYKGAVMELTLAPEFAKRAWYSIPYKDKETNQVVNVEGPSIKAAMALARRWGNCANAGRIVENLDDRLVVEGVFMDYETNLRTLRTISVAKKYWSKAMKMVVPLREDRLNMAIQAGMSKAIRNAILASLPAALVDTYVAAAKKVAVAAVKGAPGVKEQTVKEKIAASIKWFVSQGAPQKAVDEYLAGQSAETDDDLLAILIGLGTSIKDGQVSIEDVFGSPETTTAAPATIPSVGDLLGGGKAPEVKK
jgi:hypothetical protein